MIVLGWLRGHPDRFKTFVGNRVSKTLDLISPSCWNHARGTDNPADLATHGLYLGELVGNNLRWQGPSWLWQAKTMPAIHQKLSDVPMPFEENKEQQVSLLFGINELNLSEQFPTYSRVKSVTAWLLHFKSHFHRRDNNRIWSVTFKTDELLNAEQHWIWKVQQHEYIEQITTMKEKNHLPHSSKLLPLHPIVDEEGQLHVRGRMKHAVLLSHRHYPIVLPKSHTFTKLLVRSEHQRLLHGGPTLVRASLSRRFYIIK